MGRGKKHSPSSGACLAHGSVLRPLSPREGTLQRFGADILDRLAAEKAIPRKESWGEWVMTEQVCTSRTSCLHAQRIQAVHAQGAVGREPPASWPTLRPPCAQ